MPIPLPSLLPLTASINNLDREAFCSVVKVLALKIPTKKCSLYRQQLEPFLLNQPRLTNIVPTESNDWKYLLLNRHYSRDKLDSNISKIMENDKLCLIDYSLNINYDYWSTDEVLKAIIPPEVPITTSYEQIGHIAHLNLLDETLPYKHLIGQVILDKNKNIKTVVNKLDNIDTTFRFFKMEVLAGEECFKTEVKENDCRFKFDFSKVYWNSRLHTEHRRLIDTFGKGQTICDVFAGVGPFAIPAAKLNQCVVYANDLNPVSFDCLKNNIVLNKVKNVIPFNLDGREFIRQSLKELRQTSNLEKGESALSGSTLAIFHHYVMNLPATAIEFLDAFIGLYADYRDKISVEELPMLHVHCFTKSTEPEKDIQERVEAVLQCSISSSEVHYVRSVSPTKDMYCISFKLPAKVAFYEKNLDNVEDGQPKRKVYGELETNDVEKKKIKN